MGGDCRTVLGDLVAYAKDIMIEQCRTHELKLRAYLLRFVVTVLLIATIAITVDSFRQPSDQLSSRLAVSCITLYQRKISGKLPYVHCRHRETCSNYSKRVFQERGFWGGLYLSAKRLNHCF